ncbi:isochorismatase family protein [Deinococcus budaensis]|uniref:Nicotinamidase-related amidase n=1 Tax=Deinococcus budaensis TaxID=1665626 RepID=A0A7W8GHV5_9DEIO|nr:isochorismatase family protein [Deinococcus budaensis]MBB5235619.1 nicotinamidase-related amidase [Deinococcus budaensis]
MTLTPVALVLLTAQRHHLEGRPDEQAVSRRWQARVEAARAAGQLIVHVQWDGAAGTPGETFSRGWVHHPDFRAEAGDLPLRAAGPDAFARTALDAELRGRAVRELHLLALPGAAALPTTERAARALGYAVQVLEGHAEAGAAASSPL